VSAALNAAAVVTPSDSLGTRAGPVPDRFFVALAVIGTRLIINQPTVACHLREVLNKLGTAACKQAERDASRRRPTLRE
jgi:hypothetical protein